jgi:hypothetical protein
MGGGASPRRGLAPPKKNGISLSDLHAEPPAYPYSQKT